MTNQAPVQAAVVQMLIAKRPRLGQLPISWTLHNDGTISVDQAWNATKPSDVVEIAQELARALRGGKVDIGEERKHTTSGRMYRAHRVTGAQNGVHIHFQAFEYLDGHGDELPEAGETA
ncbi:hypothetical protein ACGFZS_09615 [Streptomyces sp. NPDC048288]|uniref:hypothetical protein n=1 Tax=Streptomyces sp. NPDC048288 TaxID=3365529 RepID=UPI00371A51EE